MAKVIMTIAADDGMCFEDILSFKTENYIGIWDYEKDAFIMFRNSGRYFEPHYLKACENLQELYDAVNEYCDEHIKEVFDDIDYTIELG